MGGNAFLRFSSSVAAGALILPQVARAQTTCDAPESPPGGNGCCAPVKTYEGCGSCEDPTLRLLTTVVPPSMGQPHVPRAQGRGDKAQSPKRPQGTQGPRGP